MHPGLTATARLFSLASSSLQFHTVSLASALTACGGKDESRSVETHSAVTRDGVRWWLAASLLSLSQCQPHSHV